jgi:hypothetical protein
MSKLVVVLLPGGTPEYLTVDDNQTTVTWYRSPEVAGDTGQTLPIETYFCEGEEFYFARLEKRPEEDVSSSISYLTAQKADSFIGLMSGFRQVFSFLTQFVNMNIPKKIRAK